MEKHLIVRLDVKQTTTYGMLRDALAADPGRPDYGLTPAQAAHAG